MNIKTNIFFSPRIVLLISIVFLITSCGSNKDIIYFQNANSFETMVATDSYMPKFKVGDVIGIHVSTLDPEASRPFNVQVMPTTVGEQGDISSGQIDYIVDTDGNIGFPVLGTVKILGLSPTEVKTLLAAELSDYLINPIINVRLKSFKVTILGEVRRPGSYPVGGERITILEALGLAGDLTIKGKRDNVLIIRDFNGTKVYTRIDLTKKEVMKSPVYYLTQNDVIYVEPNNSAVASSTLDNRTTIAISVASLLITSTVFILFR